MNSSKNSRSGDESRKEKLDEDQHFFSCNLEKFLCLESCLGRWIFLVGSFSSFLCPRVVYAHGIATALPRSHHSVFRQGGLLTSVTCALSCSQWHQKDHCGQAELVAVRSRQRLVPTQTCRWLFCGLYSRV